MKDNVLDLLIYLFENYMSADDEPRPDRNVLKIELDKAGFAEPDVDPLTTLPFWPALARGARAPDEERPPHY